MKNLLNSGERLINGITLDIYKKIQQNKTWKELWNEIDLEDERLYQDTCNFIKSILSQAS